MSGATISILSLLAIPLFGVQSEKPSAPETPAQEVQKQEAPPSLLELARRERERRAAGAETAPVLRNEDLGRLKQARVATSQASRAKSAVANETTEEVTEEADAGEPVPGAAEGDLEYWRAAFDEARQVLEEAISRRMVLELRMNNLRNAYLQTADGSTREQIVAQLNETFLEVGQAREDEKAARQALTELERQAIRSGIPPGQVRDLIGKLPESSSIFDGIPQPADAPQ